MSEKKPKSTVLTDHKKIGKNFVPPYVYLLGEGTDIKWRQRMLPEYLWLSLLNLQIGWIDGADISLSFARIAANVTGVPSEEFSKKFGKAPKLFFGLTTSFSLLNKKQLKSIVSKLEKQGKLEPLQYSLKGLVSFYPKCPLSFIFGSKKPEPKEEYLPIIKESVSKFFDKYDSLTVSALTNAVYIAFCTNKLRVIVSDDRNSKDDSHLANFPEIEKYPNTEESRIVAAQVRIAAANFANQEENVSEDWSNYFWNRGLEIESCSSPPLNKLNKENE
jgi:hypothetical protein